MIKFALAKEHRTHFEKNQFIELEGLLTPQQIYLLKDNASRVLSNSTSAESGWRQIDKSERKFKEGRDLWRTNPAIRKFVIDKGLAKIASELLGVRFLRLGYDQFLPDTTGCHSLEWANANISYNSLLNKSATLEEISCLRGVLGGVCVALHSLESAETDENEQAFPFSKHLGNVVFFSADKILNFAELKKRPTQEFLLIVYAAKTTLYVPNDSDAHQHALKHLGYVFGDKLNDELNPVVCRS